MAVFIKHHFNVSTCGHYLLQLMKFRYLGPRINTSFLPYEKKVSQVYIYMDGQYVVGGWGYS